MIQFLAKNLYRFKQIIKYLISGSIAAIVDLSLLYVFTDFLKWWYLISAGLAFIISFFVSFFLQKFWTFRDNNRDVMYRQMTSYFLLAAVNIAVNTALMYLLVDIFKIWYILGQIIAAGLIACESFILYKFLIFNEQPNKEEGIKQRGGLKVLIATGIYPPDIGGPAIYAEPLKRELEKLGCEVKVVTYSSKDKNSTPPINIFYVSREKNIITRYFKYFIKVWQLAKWSDIVYTLDLVSAGFPATIAAKIRKRKVIFRTGGDFLWEKAYHNSWTDLPLTKYYESKKSLKEKLLIIFCQWIMKKIDLIIFSTRLQAGIYNKYYKVPEARIKLVANPIPEVVVDNLSDQYKNNLIFAGRLIKLKNLDRLISAFGKVKSLGVTMLIFGDGPESENLKAMVNNLGLDNRIKIMGKIGHNELLKIVSGCRFFILPSVTEISPNLALECLAMLKPIILTKETGLDKNVTNNLITIDPLSEGDIRSKIEYLLDESNLIDYQRKIKNINIVKRNWNNVAYDHLVIFNSLI